MVYSCFLYKDASLNFGSVFATLVNFFEDHILAATDLKHLRGTGPGTQEFHNQNHTFDTHLVVFGFCYR